MAADGAPFPYLAWARPHLPPNDPHSLGLSGRRRLTAREAPALTSPFLGDGSPPEQPLREALARRYGVPAEGVHLTVGTSHANFIAYLTFARGGHVAAESPAYEALLRLPAAVGATLTTFARDPEREWRINAASLAKAVGPETDLIAVTDLHNPSGARLAPADLDLLVDAAEAHDALLLVDEVYLDLDPLDRPTAALRHPRVLTTNSLTKSHGLGDLRSGWLLGTAALVERVRRWDDLVVPTLPWLPMKEALAYLEVERPLLEETRMAAATATARVDAWVASRDDVRWRAPDAGFTGFLRLGRPGAPLDGDQVARLLWDASQVQAVPGSFFQTPNGLRISYLHEPATLDRVLACLGRALDASG